MLFRSEFIFGEPEYEQTNCISYLIAKLTENGFRVQYLHPNTIFVSWEEWIPQYVRSEIKKKTGKIINEKGQVIADLRANDDPVDDPIRFSDPLNPTQYQKQQQPQTKPKGAR